ncbi:MAG: ATP-binding protein [Sandaracinaceae bacterium]
MKHLWKLMVLMLVPLLGGVVAVTTLTAVFSDEVESSYGEWLLGSGVQLAADDISALPPSARPDRVRAIQKRYSTPIALVGASDDVPPGACQDSVVSKRTGVGPGPHVQVFIPLGAGQCLVAGPAEPPFTPSVGAAIIGGSSVALAFLIASGIALRQRQQIEVLNNAARTLGAGALQSRVATASLGSLSAVGDQFNEMAEGLQADFERREALLAAIAHEIGTPLARIRFAVALLRDRDRPETRARHLEGIESDVTAIESLSEEVTMWLQVGGKLAGDAHAPLREVIEAVGDAVPEGISLDVDIADLEVHAELRSVERVLDNLLDNAGRHAKSRVIVEASSDGGDAVIEVRDDGPGIPADARARALEPFTRLDESRSRKTGGMGLGLPIVRRIVEGHGGSVKLGAAPEGGLRCTIRWPLAAGMR